MHTVRPQNYNEIVHVGHLFRMGLPVVMDLSDLSKADALPLVDFAAGLIVGRGGSMEQVESRVFLLVPAERAARSA